MILSKAISPISLKRPSSKINICRLGRYEYEVDYKTILNKDKLIIFPNVFFPISNELRLGRSNFNIIKKEYFQLSHSSLY